VLAQENFRVRCQHGVWHVDTAVAENPRHDRSLARFPSTLPSKLNGDHALSLLRTTRGLSRGTAIEIAKTGRINLIRVRVS